MDDKNIKNRGLIDKLKIDLESYENLLNMLNSNEEDQIVAFKCMDNINQKDSLIYTLFLRKNTTSKYSLWVSHCPKVILYHESLGISEHSNILQYKTIFEIIKNQSNKQENLEFFIKQFSIWLTKSLDRSFEFIEDLDITVKYKKQND